MAYADLDKKREYQRAWLRNKRAQQPGTLRKYRRDYYAANRGRIRAQEKQRYMDAPDQPRNTARNGASLRRALKANAPQGDSAEAATYEQILRQGICELCGVHGPLHVDHIEALSTSGEHGWENFSGLCQSCNSSKGTKPLLAHMLEGVR